MPAGEILDPKKQIRAMYRVPSVDDLVAIRAFGQIHKGRVVRVTKIRALVEYRTPSNPDLVRQVWAAPAALPEPGIRSAPMWWAVDC